MNETSIPVGYYAVPDPDQPNELMTYWHVRGAAGPDAFHFVAWPLRARYGPKLLRKDVPKDHEGRMAAIRAHQQVLLDWNQRLYTALASEPDAAAERFARLTTRCFWCARALTDPKSKLLGMGPDCRRSMGLDDEALIEQMTPAVAAAHAAHLAKAG
jgi:Family of unknown function (DUF6011)